MGQERHGRAAEITDHPKVTPSILAVPLLEKVFGGSVIFAKIPEDSVDNDTWKNERVQRAAFDLMFLTCTPLYPGRPCCRSLSEMIAEQSPAILGLEVFDDRDTSLAQCATIPFQHLGFFPPL